MARSIVNCRSFRAPVHSRMGGWGARDEANKLFVNRYEHLKYIPDEEYHPYDRAPSMVVEKNLFQEGIMKLMGGGELHQYNKCTDQIRIGGGIDDLQRAINRIDKNKDRCFNRFSPDHYLQKMGGSLGCVAPISLRDVGFEQNQNTQANPGPTYKSMGFKTKGECLPLAISVSENLISQSLTEDIVGRGVPRYAMAGRPSKLTRTRAKEKLAEGKLLGRAVYMADAHEALMAARFVIPLTKWAHDYSNGIYVGFNKFSGDPTKIVERISKFNSFINGDFSAFDTNVGPQQISLAFDIIRRLLAVGREEISSDSRCLSWLEDCLINTHVVLPTGRTVITREGLPSGSGLTAIVGTIINFVYMTDALADSSVKSYHLGVQGDDNIIAFNVKKGDDKWDHHHKIISGKVAESVSERFGAVFNPEKCHFADKIAIGYATPRAPEFILNGSSTILREYFSGEERRLGRKLTFLEKWVPLDRDPSGPAPGLTHRWTNIFFRRIKFLSHYFKAVDTPDGTKYTMVRPTPEVIEGFVIPERPVKTIHDQIQRLQSALIEHYDNSHVVNHIMHYVYDAWICRESGVFKRHDFKNIESIPTIRERAWYRKIDEAVDLISYDIEFAKFWFGFEREAKKIREYVFNRGTVEWVHIRNLRMGRVNLGSASKMFREVSPADFNSLSTFRGDLESVGQLGLTLWTKPNEVKFIAGKILEMYRERKMSVYDERFVMCQRRVSLLRGMG